MEAALRTMNEPRPDRTLPAGGDPVSRNVVVRETDLCTRAKRAVTEKARQSASAERAHLGGCVRQHPGFAVAVEPLPVDDLVKV